jgi:hypothetical protein
MFRDCRLARMSDGHYCLVRDLGPVKGGKGLKHHEVVVDFNLRGIRNFSKRAIVEGMLRIAQRVRPRGHAESDAEAEQPSSGVAPRRRPPSQSQNGRSSHAGRLSDRQAGQSAATRSTDAHIPLSGTRDAGVSVRRY